MSALLTMTPAEFCAATRACTDGRKFALRYPTMAEVWDACPKPEWLLWITRRLGQRPDDRTLRLFAVWCARSTPLRDGRVTGDLLTDPRPLAALDVAERYAHGQATDMELRSAYFAAALARADAPSRCAAYAYAAAIAAAETAADAAYAALAAADAAYADAAADAALYTADVACRAQADQFRLLVPNPFRVGEGQK